MESNSKKQNDGAMDLPAGILCLDVEQQRAPAAPQSSSFHPTSSLLYHYQMVQLSLYKHWKENPAEAILKIGGTDFSWAFQILILKGE